MSKPISQDERHFPEFAKFLQNCHDGVAATYTDKEKKQTLYNRQAVDQLLAEEIRRDYIAKEAVATAIGADEPNNYHGASYRNSLRHDIRQALNLNPTPRQEDSHEQ